MEYSPSSYLSLPENPGVYRFLDTKRDILYVGKANNLKARVSSYFANTTQLGEKTQLLVSQIKHIQVTFVETELEALLLESFYIKKFRPKYNIRLTDDKTYPLIKITLKSDNPAVLYARRMDDPNALYFGPFPHPKDVRNVLRVIRRIFPFQSVPNHGKRVCLYNHLHLCPCIPVHNTKEDIQAYKKDLRRIVKILEGRSHELHKDLERERKEAVKQEAFEKAQVMSHQISALEVITKPHRKPLEYDLNPNLREDMRSDELTSLQNVLTEKGVPTNYLKRIECFDISNTQGTHATGSMVVFTDGEKDGNQYRRFKIKKDGKPNDFAMMEEVLQRRIRHSEWQHPHLLIVDGGKGQVTSALRAFERTGVSFPLIGLAKREETIVIPNTKYEVRNTKQSQNTNDKNVKRFEHSDVTNSNVFRASGFDIRNFTEVSLPKNSPALLLIRRIRDEAHRFAITYHRKVRSKQFLK